jgi:hypothetical protein
MISSNLNELELHTPAPSKGSRRSRRTSPFPTFWATGNASTAVLCVELEPGKAGPLPFRATRASSRCTATAVPDARDLA